MKGAQRSTRPSVRWAFGPLLGLIAAGAVGAVSASGCGENWEVFSACPTDGKGNLTVPDECCPCATPEECNIIYYSKGLTPPPVPQSCCDKGYDVPACWDAGPAAMQMCPGPCVPPAPEGWTGPELVYSGPGLVPPSCPTDAPAIVFEGAAEPVVEPHECPACACDTPVGTCKLPETWTVSSAACAAPGSGIETPFDPPAGWDGICSADDVIPDGKLCSGKPCVQSLTVSAPVIEEQPCEVVTKCPNGPEQEPPKAGDEPATSFKPEAGLPTPPAPPACTPPAASAPWSNALALACAADGPWPVCEKDASQVCLPAAGDFAACVRKTGDEACPEGWPVRQLVYDDVAVERSCSPCACDVPAGGECIVEAAVTSGNACDGMTWQLNVSSAEPPKCVDLMSGTALASKQAALWSYQPGSCEPSGGAPLVTVKLGVPTTICCQAGP